MLDKILSNKYSSFSISLGLTAAASATLFTGLDLDREQLKFMLGEAASNQIAQAGFFFTLAAWIHSGRVKKEIKENFSSLTNAINNVAESLRQDLKKHSDKLSEHSAELGSLKNKVASLEIAHQTIKGE